MEPPPTRNFQSCITNYWLDLWVENPRNKGDSSWAHHEGGWGGEGCPWVAADASLLPLPYFLQSLLQSLPSLALRVLACSWVGREREWILQMGGWVWECGFSWGLSHFVLICGSYFHKWQTTHFPLFAADLRFIRYSNRSSGLSGNLLSLLNWFNYQVGWQWRLSYCVLMWSLMLSWC